MNARISIFMFFIVAGAIFSLISSVNFAVDPMCYYRCPKIVVDKITTNAYYRVGQTVINNPDAGLIVIGSSRGETTSPSWLTHTTGLKTINLSTGGTELQAKIAFLNIALKHTAVHKIIWQADFFELIPEILDVKMKGTGALRDFLNSEFPNSQQVSFAERLSSLIDHLTFEATLNRFKSKSRKALDQGSGSQLDYQNCESKDYTGEQSPENLNKEILSDFDRYRSSIFKTKATDEYWNIFVEKMKSLSFQNKDVLVWIAPYNPVFTESLKTQYPEVYKSHLTWVNKLKSLQIPHVRVVNYFDGIPGDDGSVRFWNDGVHFTCKASILMLKGHLAP